MVVAVIALLTALAGTGYAALKLPKNAVGAKQLKKNSVTMAKIRKNAVTSAKVKAHTLTGSDINLNKLGTVPSAETANTVPPREAVHQVGAPNEPAFASGTGNLGSSLPGVTLPPVGFFKDHDDVVHLEGAAKVENLESRIFQLPAGFRPQSGVVQIYEPVAAGVVIVAGSNVVLEGKDISGLVLASKESVLSGITFRAGS
jgi:hypothetical protein